VTSLNAALIDPAIRCGVISRSNRPANGQPD